jgi:hypothetical protein
VDQDSITMTVNGDPIPEAFLSIQGSGADTLVVYDPADPLDEGRAYIVRIDAQDRSDPPDEMTQNNSWTFTTVADAPPYLQDPGPAPGSVGVPVTTDITVHVKDDGTGVDPDSVTMTVNGDPIPAAYLSIQGSEADTLLVYDPAGPLEEGVAYTVRIDAQDQSDPPNVMTQDNEWTFTTDGALHGAGSGPASAPPADDGALREYMIPPRRSDESVDAIPQP